MLRKARIRLTGKGDLLVHNGQTADPRNHYAKQLKTVSGKRKKTEADLDQLAKIEWFAGHYIQRVIAEDGTASVETVLPAHVLESAIINGAKKSKRGPQAKAGIYVDQAAVLDFKGKPQGPLDEEQMQSALDELYEGGEHHLTAGVKVGQAKVMRTRPKLAEWSASTVIEFDETQVTLSDVTEIIEDAGRMVGVGDWRPKYGRFDATVELVS